MKNVILGTLLASGLLLAQNHVSSFDREALKTQSPRVHTSAKHHKKKMRSEDRVTADKKTINAYVPNGK